MEQKKGITMIRSGPRRLAGERVTLREVEPDDGESLFVWRTQPRLTPLFHSAGPGGREEHLQFVEAYFAPENDDAWFVIEHGGVPVGALALYHPGPRGAREAGRLVMAPGVRGLLAFRLAREAIELLMKFALVRGERRMRCEVMEENRVMRAILSSLGFSVAAVGERAGRPFVEMVAELGLESRHGERG